MLNELEKRLTSLEKEVNNLTAKLEAVKREASYYHKKAKTFSESLGSIMDLPQKPEALGDLRFNSVDSNTTKPTPTLPTSKNPYFRVKCPKDIRYTRLTPGKLYFGKLNSEGIGGITTNDIGNPIVISFYADFLLNGQDWIMKSPPSLVAKLKCSPFGAHLGLTPGKTYYGDMGDNKTMLIQDDGGFPRAICITPDWEILYQELPARQTQSQSQSQETNPMLNEDDPCPDPNCSGTMIYNEVENCSCFINPPCSACTNNPLICSECGCGEKELKIPADKNHAHSPLPLLWQELPPGHAALSRFRAQHAGITYTLEAWLLPQVFEWCLSSSARPGVLFRNRDIGLDDREAAQIYAERHIAKETRQTQQPLSSDRAFWKESPKP